MKILRGADLKKFRDEFPNALQVWLVYLDEMYFYKSEDEEAKKQFTFVSELIYTTKYIVTENTEPTFYIKREFFPFEDFFNEKQNIVANLESENGSEVNGEGFNEEEHTVESVKDKIDENEDDDDDIGLEAEASERAFFEKDYKRESIQWDKLENEKNFFGRPYFYTRDGLYKSRDGDKVNIDFVIRYIAPNHATHITQTMPVISV